MHVQSCCFAHEFDRFYDVVVIVVVALTPYYHENHALLGVTYPSTPNKRLTPRFRANLPGYLRFLLELVTPFRE